MTKRPFVFAATLLFVLAVSTAAMAADDPMAGTWKLNLAKSSFSPGPPPKSETIKAEVQGSTIKHTIDSVRDDGQASHSEQTVIVDGKPYPVKGHSWDENIGTRVDANTILLVGKKAGQEVFTYRFVVSDDGETLTVTRNSKLGDRGPVKNVSVYDRQ